MDDARAREFVLEAAALLVQEGGAEVLTHEAVAAAAGLAVADVKRLFPDRETLAIAMADRISAAFFQAASEACGDDETPGAWARAFVRVGFDLDEEGSLSRVARALLSSVVYRPYMLDAVREREAEIQHMIEASGVPLERAVVLRAAMAGFFYSRMFGIELLAPDSRGAVEAELLALTYPDAPEAARAAG